MSHLFRPAIAGVAFLLTCGVVGAGDPAFAASGHSKPAAHSHPTSHGHASSHGHPASHKPVDKLAGMRKGAAKALAADAARVRRVAAAAAGSAVLSAADKSALATATAADLA